MGYEEALLLSLDLMVLLVEGLLDFVRVLELQSSQLYVVHIHLL